MISLLWLFSGLAAAVSAAENGVFGAQANSDMLGERAAEFDVNDSLHHTTDGCVKAVSFQISSARKLHVPSHPNAASHNSVGLVLYSSQVLDVRCQLG